MKLLLLRVYLLLAVIFPCFSQTLYAEESAPVKIIDSAKSISNSPDSLSKQEDPNLVPYRTTRHFLSHILVLPSSIWNGIWWPLGQGVIWFEQNHLHKKIVGFLSSDDGRRIVYPVFDNRMFGATYVQKDLIGKDSRMLLTATLGFNNRQRYEVAFRRLGFGKLGTGLFNGLYQFLQDEPFFGIGPDSDFDSSRTNYAREIMDILVGLGIRPSDRLALGLTVEYTINNIFEGQDTRYPSTTDVFDSETLPGLETGVKLGSVGLAVLYDYRNRLFRPTKGGFVFLRADAYQDAVGDEYGFTKLFLDASTIISLFNERRFTIRIGGEINEPFKDRVIPFYYLAQLGTQETIRGYQRGRFRDTDMVLGSLQYNYAIWDAMDTFLFVDAGKVARDIFKEFSSVTTHVGYGGGFRIWGQKGAIADFIFSWSVDGFRFYFNLNPGLELFKILR